MLNCLRRALAGFVRFCLWLRYGSKGKSLPSITDDILKVSAMEVARKIRHKEVTSVQVIQTCIKRIKAVNPTLNCIIDYRFEHALKEAEEADRLIQNWNRSIEELEEEKPLLGVPFTTKDSIGVKGLHLSCGIYLYKDVIAEQDAEVVRLLKEKGAIVIGLTNVPEICMWWESYNKIYGYSKNPYNTGRITGGSSGGEAGCQAAACAYFGIGSDIGGSIRMPAFFTGIFGHKPTKFTVSLKGSWPPSGSELEESFIGFGPMSRYATDLKPILKIITPEYQAKLRLDEPVDLKKVKFYYQFKNKVPLTDPVDDDIVNALKKVVSYLKTDLNIQAQEKKLPLHETMDMWMTLLGIGGKPMGPQIMANYSKSKNVKEIFKGFIGQSKNTMTALLGAVASAKLDDATKNKYFKKQEDLHKLFDDLLGDDGVFLFPTHPTPALYHSESLVRPFNAAYTVFVNILGLPATAVPLGLGKQGLPIGIQVVANLHQDRLCLAVAEELERAFHGWVEPHKPKKETI